MPSGSFGLLFICFYKCMLVGVLLSVTMGIVAFLKMSDHKSKCFNVGIVFDAPYPTRKRTTKGFHYHKIP